MPSSNVEKLSEQSQENELIKQILLYFRENKMACDKEYELAMDPDISKIYKNVKGNLEKELVKVSIVILTANKFEKNILHQYVYSRTKKPIIQAEIKLFEQPESHNITNAFFFELEGYCVLHIACQVTGSYTIGGCADAVRYCIDSPYVFPTAFISYGICFGCREEDSHLCDTVISKKVYPYFIGAKIDGEKLKTVDDYVFEMSSDMEKKIKEYFDKNKFQSNILTFDVEYSNYITGEAVVSSRTARDLFIGTTTQKIYAGDMEAYGLFKECKNAYRSIPCTVIKSICDWGIEKNLNDSNTFSEVMGPGVDKKEVTLVKDKLQALAAAHSFKVLEILLKGIENNEGQIEKPFDISIYKRIRDKIIKNTRFVHAWDKNRLEREAIKLNKELKNKLAYDFIDTLCNQLAEEGLVTVKPQHIVVKEDR